MNELPVDVQGGCEWNSLKGIGNWLFVGSASRLVEVAPQAIADAPRMVELLMSRERDGESAVSVGAPAGLRGFAWGCRGLLWGRCRVVSFIVCDGVCGPGPVRRRRGDRW